MPRLMTSRDKYAQNVMAEWTETPRSGSGHRPQITGTPCMCNLTELPADIQTLLIPVWNFGKDGQ